VRIRRRKDAATASRMQLRRCGESPGRRTDKERTNRHGRHRPGGSADPIAALAMAGRTQDRCRGKSLAIAPTTQRTIMVGRFGRVVMRHDGTGRGRRQATSRRWGWPSGGAGDVGAGPMGMLRRSPCVEPGDPPYDARGRDSLCQSRTTGSDLSRSQFAPGRTPSNIPGRKTAPYGWIDGYLRRICNRGRQPGALPLFGLGLPDLLDWLQCREILHQEPVSEDVTTADFA
jgi:hypothetical protein